ncbi:hypothetical protein [Halopiger djelfimassiliensis]|uniref:hypothetical protein n=1 Tax=Halopiger djelfimassiliensis TaxID=1293047 RepID=UPI00067808BB|nr:hypothetical protein [Halopiger djelfimassiliensis]
MNRRNVLRRIGALAGVAPLAGCLEASEVVEQTGDQLEEKAEDEVDNVVDGLERPPTADLRIDPDGTITVMSLGTNTAGVKCGPIEGDDPLEEIETHEKAADSAGEMIEACEATTVVAVSESGNVAVIEEL